MIIMCNLIVNNALAARKIDVEIYATAENEQFTYSLNLFIIRHTSNFNEI